MTSKKSITAFKGFDNSLKCRNFQYEIGKTYTHKGSVVRCTDNGFHSCEYPLDVFNYYNPGSRFAIVEASGKIDKGANDSKLASGKLLISKEISLSELATHAVEYVLSKIDASLTQSNTGLYSASTNTGHRSASTNTGVRSASTNTGHYSASTNTGVRSASTNTGVRSASTNTGPRSASTNTGHYSASTNTGNCSASTNTGDYSASTNTGNHSASTNTGDCSASTNTGHRSASTNTGNYSASTNTGDYSASTNTGNYSASIVSGNDSVAIATGYDSRAKASLGSAIVLVYRNPDNMKLTHIRSEIVGNNGIKPDTFYKLDEDGNFVECE